MSPGKTAQLEKPMPVVLFLAATVIEGSANESKSVFKLVRRTSNNLLQHSRDFHQQSSYHCTQARNEQEMTHTYICQGTAFPTEDMINPLTFSLF